MYVLKKIEGKCIIEVFVNVFFFKICGDYSGKVSIGMFGRDS